MVELQGYEIQWRKWEPGRETQRDYKDLLSKSSQQRCPGCMKLLVFKPGSVWRWNLRICESEMERKGAMKRRPGTEMCPWTPGSAGSLWFHRLFSKTYLQLVTRWGLKATWACLSVWSCRDLSSYRKVSVMFHLNQCNTMYRHTCVSENETSGVCHECLIRKLKRGIGCEMWARFADSPCVTLNQWQPGPHARNSRSNSAAWWLWTQPWLGGSIYTHTHRSAHILCLCSSLKNITWQNPRRPDKLWPIGSLPPWVWSLCLCWVLITTLWPSLTFPSLPGSHMSFGWLKQCLYKKDLPLTALSNSLQPLDYVIPLWHNLGSHLPVPRGCQIPAKVYITNARQGNATMAMAA